tara:strand:- start:5872 stop:6051 length:180 start_codon:yes stop_codon:yes gene_type:complete
MTLSGEKYISFMKNRSGTSSWYVVQIQRNGFRYQKSSPCLNEAIIIRNKTLALFGEAIS